MAEIVSDTTQTLADGGTVRTITYSDGAQSVQYVPGPGTPAANQRIIQSRLRVMLEANVTYLAIATPTAAQNTAQLGRVTKECSALIRLMLNELDDVSGT